MKVHGHSWQRVVSGLAILVLVAWLGAGSALAESLFYEGFPRALRAAPASEKNSWNIIESGTGQTAGRLQRTDSGAFRIYDETDRAVGIILPSNNWVPVGGATTRKTQVKPRDAQLFLEMVQVVQSLK